MPVMVISSIGIARLNSTSDWPRFAASRRVRLHLDRILITASGTVMEVVRRETVPLSSRAIHLPWKHLETILGNERHGYKVVKG